MSDYRRNPTLGQVLNHLGDVLKRQIRIAMPCAVNTYYPATQTVDVQPLIDDRLEQEDGTLAVASFPVLTNVPVAFPSGGGFRLTFPISPGDTGQILISDLSMDLWQQQGGHVSPPAGRRHHIADAVFYPGLHPDNASWTGASTTGVTLGHDGGPQVIVRASGVELGGTDTNPPTDAIALASLVQANLATLRTFLQTWLPTGTPSDGAAWTALLLATFGPPLPAPQAFPVSVAGATKAT